jgi:hypothetical protein
MDAFSVIDDQFSSPVFPSNSSGEEFWHGDIPPFDVQCAKPSALLHLSPDMHWGRSDAYRFLQVLVGPHERQDVALQNKPVQGDVRGLQIPLGTTPSGRQTDSHAD